MPCAHSPADARSPLLLCVFEWFERAKPVKLRKSEVQTSSEPMKLNFWLFKKAVLAFAHTPGGPPTSITSVVGCGK